MPNRHTSFEAIGTKWSIDARAEISQAQWSQLLARVTKCIDSFDKKFSRFRPDSLISQMAQKTGSYTLPEETYRLLRFYESLYRATDGSLTPLIGQTISDAGYDARYSFKLKPLTKPSTWEDVIVYDRQNITLKKPALLDFGAAGKGYLVDIVGRILKRAGLKSYVISAGGDILQRSHDNASLEVGLEHPSDPKQAVGITKISNQSLCASSHSRRSWGKFSHIIDPRTLSSPENIAATWVIANNTMTADGIATALFFAPPKKLASFKFNYAILYKDMSLRYSKGFPLKLFEPSDI